MQLLIAILLIGLAFMALGFNIFFRRGKKFPEYEIGHNKKMHELGIHCVKCDEVKKAGKKNGTRNFKINPQKLKIDISGFKVN